ncbi:hypothetical protein RHSP_35863 [Rhizobium freirei PRF 81]|uniref:Uncharacterized protein n=1 Tax=Rhizobium freirei PRF 81 TaxID=363754 RepID=N6V3T1_9HYPH|nr:hypothetical protein RHSP_35863 [Rhizobium freirei PRF 81]
MSPPYSISRTNKKEEEKKVIERGRNQLKSFEKMLIRKIIRCRSILGCLRIDDPVEHLAPIGHAHRRSVVSGFEKREARRIVFLIELFEQGLLTRRGIDRVFAAMREPERQFCLVEDTLREIRIGHPAQDRHALQPLDALGIAGDAPADEAAHGGAGEDDGLAARLLIGIADQRGDIGNPIAVETLDARRIISAAVSVGEVLQPVEIAAERIVVGAEAAVAATTVDEDDGEGLLRCRTYAGDIHFAVAELQGFIFLRLPAHARVDIGRLGALFRNLVAAVDIPHLLIIDRLERTVVVTFDNGLIGKQLVLERLQHLGGSALGGRQKQNARDCGQDGQMSCGHSHADTSSDRPSGLPFVTRQRKSLS